MIKKKALVVVDMQNDFIDGSLKNESAQKIVPNVVKFIEDWNDSIFITRDTHLENYLSTSEGKKLPVEHCIANTKGWELNEEVQAALDKKPKDRAWYFNKPVFGSVRLTDALLKWQFDEIVFLGIATDICVISNVMLAKTYLPDANIAVKADCCAGITPETHEAALKVMQMCQIDII